MPIDGIAQNSTNNSNSSNETVLSDTKLSIGLVILIVLIIVGVPLSIFILAKCLEKRFGYSLLKQKIIPKTTDLKLMPNEQTQDVPMGISVKTEKAVDVELSGALKIHNFSMQNVDMYDTMQSHQKDNLHVILNLNESLDAKSEASNKDFVKRMSRQAKMIHKLFPTEVQSGIPSSKNIVGDYQNQNDISQIQSQQNLSVALNTLKSIKSNQRKLMHLDAMPSISNLREVQQNIQYKPSSNDARVKQKKTNYLKLELSIEEDLNEIEEDIFNYRSKPQENLIFISNSNLTIDDDNRGEAESSSRRQTFPITSNQQIETADKKDQDSYEQLLVKLEQESVISSNQRNFGRNDKKSSPILVNDSITAGSQVLSNKSNIVDKSPVRRSGTDQNQKTQAFQKGKTVSIDDYTDQVRNLESPETARVTRTQLKKNQISQTTDISQARLKKQLNIINKQI